jgi:hypothetical protein
VKTEWRVTGGAGVFIVPWAVLYWVTSGERAGSVLLAGCALSLLALAAYLVVSNRGRPARPADRPDGEPSPATVQLGRFPTRSPWPLVSGGGAALIGFGLAFTAWLALPGALILVVGVVGLAAEA